MPSPTNKEEYDLQVEFTPGREIPVADTLSRAYLPHCTKPEVPEQEIRCHIHFTIKQLPVSNTKLEEIKRKTANDKELQELKKFINEQNSSNNNNIPDIVKPYLTHQEEISEVEGIMMRSSRIIVPRSMRKDVF